jgi:hypothetical protein
MACPLFGGQADFSYQQPLTFLSRDFYDLVLNLFSLPSLPSLAAYPKGCSFSTQKVLGLKKNFR